MEAVTVSPKFQVVIPKEIRERLKLRPGQKLYVYVFKGNICLESPKPVTSIRGIAKGMKWKDDYRDRNDRF